MQLRQILTRQFGLQSVAEVLVLLPAVILGAYWIGGEAALVVATMVMPVIGVYYLGRSRRASAHRIDGFCSADEIAQHFDSILRDGPILGAKTACFVVTFDDPRQQFKGHDTATREKVFHLTAQRISAVIRAGDVVARLASGDLAVGLAAVKRLDLEAAIQIAARIRAAALTPLLLDDVTLHPSVSIGFCLGETAPAALGTSLLEASVAAAEDAALNGPGAIRGFQPEMGRRRKNRAELRDTVETALLEGQVQPWFQPQICADTGQISGFEALARWQHPERGVILPADFLPVIEDCGLSSQLGEVILHGALTMLTRWDQAGLVVPQVAINLSASELRAPDLVKRLEWELDRFALHPSRLAIEVLEDVAARMDDDVILKNLSDLSTRGFCVDLDDFGTGQASIANFRRFSIRRVKIDRCFVSRCDTSADQKRTVAAILTLCENLGLETVAEGVETPGEYATLAQLGCTHLQGFGIARPMAAEETFGWIERRVASQKTPAAFERRGPFL